MRVDVWTWRAGFIVLCLIPLSACSDDPAAPAEVAVDGGACADETPAFEDVAAFGTCVMCHSQEVAEPTRRGAPESVNFDAESGAEVKVEQIATEVKAGRMPPPSSGLALTANEREAILSWATCR